MATLILILVLIPLENYNSDKSLWYLPNDPGHEEEEGDALGRLVTEVGEDLRHFGDTPADDTHQAQGEWESVPGTAHAVPQIPLHPLQAGLLHRTLRHRPHYTPLHHPHPLHLHPQNSYFYFFPSYTKLHPRVPQLTDRQRKLWPPPKTPLPCKLLLCKCRRRMNEWMNGGEYYLLYLL